MTEQIIFGVLIALCVGQFVAVIKGRLVAVTYYLCVAPINYFNVWYHGSWDTARLCGAILIVGLAVKGDRGKADPTPRRGLFLALAVLGIVVTVVGQFFWPVDAMAAGTPIYGRLRAVLQIINWLITLGVAWQIGRAFTVPGAFQKARTGFLIAALLLCGYGVYQYVALQTGLPTTGIRRPFESTTTSVVQEEFASYTLSGREIFRPGSLIGEPKGLGGACVFWVALILTVYVEGKGTPAINFLMTLVLLALFLTASTSAWFGCLGGFFLAYLVFLRRGEKGLMAALRVPLLAFMLLLSAAAIFRWDVVKSTAEDILEARITSRIESAVGDLPEEVARKVLAERPHLLVTGTGLGGISFYIAEYLGGNQPFVLFPNNGVLGIICNIGLIGLGLILLMGYRGMKTILKSGARTNLQEQTLVLVGTTVLLQCLIFGAPWQFSVALGFLAAAEGIGLSCTTPPAQVSRRKGGVVMEGVS